MTASTPPTPLAAGHPLLALLRNRRRILLVGEPGTGKTTLTTAVARTLAADGRTCHSLGADPGSPGFGIPGTVGLGRWQNDHWRLERLAAICSLDAARFRLPLVSAVRSLAGSDLFETLLVDAPGVIRGAAGAELLPALADAAGVDAVVLVVRTDSAHPLQAELRILGVETLLLKADPRAHRPGKMTRALRRTEKWDAWLKQGKEQEYSLRDLLAVGTPPPQHAQQAWHGRQVALLGGAGETLAMGEVIALQNARLTVRTTALDTEPVAVLVRDAQRSEEGLLNTAKPASGQQQSSSPPPDLSTGPTRLIADRNPQPVIRLGIASAILVNGVYGDPLLHLRLRHQSRSLFFDLGEAYSLSTKTAHQVTDIFISHAHFDHIGGFLWLLRARIGELPPCRLYGPPGLGHQVAGLVRGILWDRAGARAPRFEIMEFDGNRLTQYRVTAGQPEPDPLGQHMAQNGVLLNEPGFRVRAVALDHGGTPVLAFAFEPPRQINVRQEQLAARGWPAGPWLGELKHRVLTGDTEATVMVPDGSTITVQELARELLLEQPGKRLVYATDLADTADNRQQLIALAYGAHTLVCEAPFLAAEAGHANRNGHLTARACGEIATAAAVGQLVPFHFSRRHADAPELLYQEIRTACPQVVQPTRVE